MLVRRLYTCAAMRNLYLYSSLCSFPLASLAGCATAPVEPIGEAASVRDRLERGTLRLAVAPEDSRGAVTAERRTWLGWETGAVELAIASGDVAASVDANGALVFERLALAFEPIPIPDSVIGDADAAFTGVRLAQIAPATAATTWLDDDHVDASARLELELTWAVTIDGTTAQLGRPRLPPVPVELALDGDGLAVRAALRARAPGEVWGWAGIVRLSDLELVLGASTR